MKKSTFVSCLVTLTAGGQLALAQMTPAPSPDLSNKALITNAPPHLAGSTPEAAPLHKMADEFYAWRNEQYPVRSSDSGLHTWTIA